MRLNNRQWRLKKVTAMLLQNLNENADTVLQNTKNDSQKYDLGFKRLASIHNKGECTWEVLCENSRENIFDEGFLNKIAGTVRSSKLTAIRPG